MATAVAQLPKFVPPEMGRARWTREECAELERLGLLERERFELIDGELVRKMSKSPLHNIRLAGLMKWLRARFGEDFVLQEPSIDPAAEMVRTNEPEPDAVVLRRPMREFVAANPRPADIALLVEISVTTAAYDLGAKAALYAAAGVADYWVLDLAARRTVVHRAPVGAEYTSIVAYGAEETVSPLVDGAAEFRLSELLDS